MSTVRQRLKSPQSLSLTSTYHNMVRAESRFAPNQWETALHCNDVSHWLGASLESALHGYPKVTLKVMNDWFTSLLFHIYWPSHAWNKAISNFDLENSKPWSRVWSTGKITSLAHYPTDLLPFYFTIRRIIPEIQLFQIWVIWPWKIQGHGQMWDQKSRSHIWPSIQPTHFLWFMSIGPTIPKIWPIGKVVWPWKNTYEILRKKNFQQNSSNILSGDKHHQGTYLLTFAVTGWVVLTLSWRQAHFC